MKSLFIILLTFLNILAPTKEGVTFKEVVHNNYDYYEIVVEETTNIGDVVIVKGAVNKKMYISMFVYQTEPNIHKVIINRNIVEGKVINIHKVNLTSDTEIEIVSKNDEFFKRYTIEKTDYEEFKTYAIAGKGENNFPKQKTDYNIFDIFVSLIYVFIGIIGGLVALLFVIMRRKINQGIKNNTNDNYGNIDYYVDAEFDFEDEPEKSEEELMKEAYEDYHKGKITEQELNNRLRNIWWSKKDD